MDVEAKIVGRHTRAELGMRPPRETSSNIHPERGGSTIHWGGPASTIHSHVDCKAVWLGWQIFHMGPQRKWADIAYTAGFCQHGYVLAGRGYHVRTAAQGTTHGNDVSYAFCHINDGKAPTKEAKQAAAYLVQEARDKGNAGHDVWAHRDWHGTDCPGQDLTEFVRVLAKVLAVTMTTTNNLTEDDMPTAEEIANAVWNHPAPGGENGSDGKPLTMAYVLLRAYQAAGRVEHILNEKSE